MINGEPAIPHLESCNPSAGEWGFGALPTGNWFVSIPRVRVPDAAVDNIGFLHQQYRALVELHGSSDVPLLQPILSVDGLPVPWEQLSWTHERCWLPTFRGNWGGVHLEGRLFAPIAGERGFVWVLEAWCEGPLGDAHEVTLGWRGAWEQTIHSSRLAKPMVGSRHVGLSREQADALFLEFRGAIPVFALAFCPSEEVETDFALGQEEAVSESYGQRLKPHQEIATDGPGALSFSMKNSTRLQPGERKSLALYVGIGLKEVAAVSAARDLRRRGWRDLLADTRLWLTTRVVPWADKRIEVMLNRNMFYNYFFSQGICLDSEELALVSSRTSASLRSATYRDIDAMLRSLPGLLKLDPAQARRMLEYAFTTQLRNMGIHCRFIDGAVLEPGFDLDQLCAPIQALALYFGATGDRSILMDRRVQTGVNRALEVLAGRKHPQASLYSTVLSPDDETSPLPYVTYSNARVWRALLDLAMIYDEIRDVDRAEDMKRLADDVRRDIDNHCVIGTPAGPAYASAVDLRGNHALEDWPNASLKHLPLFGFCAADESVYSNTLKWITATQEQDCRTANSRTPAENGVECSLVALLNDLMLGSEDALEVLLNSRLDDGIACEALSSNGNPIGVGNAALAGLLAFALRAKIEGVSF